MLRFWALVLMLSAFMAGCGDENASGRAYREAAERMVAARSYLADLRAEAGVTELPSGLMYKIEVRGPEDAASARGATSVLVHYRARLTDGNEIDASYERNAPARFDTETLLAGLREGISLMRLGDQFTFYLPPQLAYGARGKAPIIPANAVLIYEITLLDASRPPAAS